MGIFKDLETLAAGESLPLGVVLDELPWNAAGLLPAIAQQFDFHQAANTIEDGALEIADGHGVKVGNRTQGRRLKSARNIL